MFLGVQSESRCTRVLGTRPPCPQHPLPAPRFGQPHTPRIMPSDLRGAGHPVRTQLSPSSPLGLPLYSGDPVRCVRLLHGPWNAGCVVPGEPRPEGHLPGRSSVSGGGPQKQTPPLQGTAGNGALSPSTGAAQPRVPQVHAEAVWGTQPGARGRPSPARTAVPPPVSPLSALSCPFLSCPVNGVSQ